MPLSCPNDSHKHANPASPGSREELARAELAVPALEYVPIRPRHISKLARFPGFRRHKDDSEY
jgi:hypothetical protein